MRTAKNWENQFLKLVQVEKFDSFIRVVRRIWVLVLTLAWTTNWEDSDSLGRLYLGILDEYEEAISS